MLAASNAELALAERSNNCHGREALAGVTSGASSNTTWALVPPRPKELTPARRGVGPGRPLSSVGIDVEGAVGKIDPGIGLTKMQAGGQLFMLQSQGSFDEPGHTCGCVQVTDIGLD